MKKIQLLLTILFGFLLIEAAVIENLSAQMLPGQSKSEFDPTAIKINEDAFLGNTVPLNIKMTDDKGNSFTLRSILDKPLILTLIYYTCPGTCEPIVEGLAGALSKIKNLRLGEDYRVLTLSFDEKDTLEDAVKFRSDLAKKVTMPEGAENWIFAIAPQEDVKRLAKSLDYRYFYVEQDKLFVHPNAYIFLSPQGKITRYIFGLYPLDFDVKLAILEAAKGRTGKAPFVNRAVLACYKYDPSIRGYALNLPFVFGMIGLGLLTITLIVTFFFARSIKKRRR
jgi:protein SCO1/2